jgi:1-acyl-sn-glycerol-3-phosphate acyltransferase
VFPEETRTPSGELLPFKKGAAHLALTSGLPILPLGIAGTFRVLPRGTFLITPGPVVLAVGDPIETGGRSPRERAALTGEVRARVLELREEAASALAGTA